MLLQGIPDRAVSCTILLFIVFDIYVAIISNRTNGLGQVEQRHLEPFRCIFIPRHQTWRSGQGVFSDPSTDEAEDVVRYPSDGTSSTAKGSRRETGTPEESSEIRMM